MWDHRTVSLAPVGFGDAGMSIDILGADGNTAAVGGLDQYGNPISVPVSSVGDGSYVTTDLAAGGTPDLVGSSFTISPDAQVYNQPVSSGLNIGDALASIVKPLGAIAGTVLSSGVAGQGGQQAGGILSSLFGPRQPQEKKSASSLPSWVAPAAIAAAAILLLRS